MFTGLIENVGTIDSVTSGPAGLELRVRCNYTDVTEGESIAVNGACLTVRTVEPGAFIVAAVVTTLERTTIGHWRAGKRVNLERALRLGDRLGGHFVQGHVDGVARVTEIEKRQDALLVSVELEEDVWDYFVPKGSVTVDGVSLTVNALPSRGVLQVSLIEFTVSHTALADLKVADEVHIEADVIGKHVRHLLTPYQGR